MKKKRPSQSAKYPAATLAFYGPTDQFVTKAVIGIMRYEGNEEMDILHKWITAVGDVRRDETIGAEIQNFLKQHHVQSIITLERIIGCRHEEGKDYPEGSVCPQCPFWAHRDRFTGELKA